MCYHLSKFFNKHNPPSVFNQTASNFVLQSLHIYISVIAPLPHSCTSFCTSNTTDGEDGLARKSTQFRPVNKAFADEIQDA